MVSSHDIVALQENGTDLNSTLRHECPQLHSRPLDKLSNDYADSAAEMLSDSSLFTLDGLFELTV